HSRSYTHIIRNIVNDPAVVFDDIVTNEQIQKRAEGISAYYDDHRYLSILTSSDPHQRVYGRKGRATVQSVLIVVDYLAFHLTMA
ncbi:hypothetical protein MJM43_30175, partial [Salmonella enterica subsp. enterica serovar Montevideo]|nr:hypothetical protein [Salmonella enterica subsp. enterica serovar Montevideo]